MEFLLNQINLKITIYYSALRKFHFKGENFLRWTLLWMNGKFWMNCSKRFTASKMTQNRHLSCAKIPEGMMRMHLRKTGLITAAIAASWLVVTQERLFWIFCQRFRRKSFSEAFKVGEKVFNLNYKRLLQY